MLKTRRHSHFQKEIFATEDVEPFDQPLNLWWEIIHVGQLSLFTSESIDATIFISRDYIYIKIFQGWFGLKCITKEVRPIGNTDNLK